MPAVKLEHLRSVLRIGTQSSHEAVDDLFSTFDLAGRSGYTRFLASNHHAFDSLSRAALPKHLTSYITSSRDLLWDDLKQLGATDKPRGASPPIADPLHPVAVQYVLGGASFGQRILQQRWARSVDEIVLSAGRYLASGLSRQLWLDFLEAAKSEKRCHRTEDVIVDSANLVFALFQRSYYIVEQAYEPHRQP